MTRHELVHKLMRVQKAFMTIKTISHSSEIDRLCIEGISEVVAVGDAMHPKLIAEFKRQHADSMV